MDVSNYVLALMSKPRDIITHFVVYGTNRSPAKCKDGLPNERNNSD